MMRSLLSKLPAILLALLLYSMACTHTVQVPVLLPRTPCSLPVVPPFPDLSASACGDQVCLPPAGATAIWTWVRDAQRALEMAHVCLDSEEAPALAYTEIRYAPQIEVNQIVSEMSFGGRVQVTVHWRTCGEPNAFYSPDSKVLTICEELTLESPDVVPFAAAHEMAHAVIRQMDIPFTGSEEEAADELAAISLLVHDRVHEVLAAAKWFGTSADDPYWDEHFDGARRNWTLKCFAYGNAGMDDECTERWVRAARHWLVLLQGAITRG